MSVHSSLSGGSIQDHMHYFLVAKQGNGGDKGKNVKLDETSTTSDILTISNTTNYLAQEGNRHIPGTSIQHSLKIFALVNTIVNLRN
jgi:hypothetical protein